MEKILIAEDDTKLRNFFRMYFEKHKDTFEVIFAGDGEEAIEVLKQKYISLVITDLLMPKLDGFELLAYINNKFPHIPCIVVTGYPPSGLNQKLSNDNLIRVFQKPFRLGELTEAILQALEPDMPGGVLKGISVASFLQMIKLEEKTCLFEVLSPGKGRGVFYFNEGDLYDAVYKDFIGEEAALRLIVMQKAEIRFKNLPRKKIARRINKELTGLIMEAARRMDESDG
ncbi:MAG: response regulator [Thermodesulfobacteriota bacterium]